MLAQFAAVATIGGTVGTIIGRRITATELPQMVAALHSVVGLAAVLTSIGSVIGAAADHISTLHLVTAYLGVLIGVLFPLFICSGLSADIVSEGGVTFTGSIVAFFKLAGKMSSRPLALPGRHLINSSLLGMNLAAMGGFLAAAPAVPAVAAGYLGLNALLSFVKGYTLTAAIGGADMRTWFSVPLTRTRFNSGGPRQPSSLLC